MSLRESESLLRPQDLVRGLRGDAGEEQPPRVDPQHAVHRINTCGYTSMTWRKVKCAYYVSKGEILAQMFGIESSIRMAKKALHVRRCKRNLSGQILNLHDTMAEIFR